MTLPEDGTLAFALRHEEELKRLITHNNRTYGEGRRPKSVRFRDGSFVHAKRGKADRPVAKKEIEVEEGQQY